MTTTADHSQELHTLLDDVRRLFASADLISTPGPALWGAVQSLLQQCLQRPALTGQALIAEARQVGILTLADAHVLVALASWAGRSTVAARNEEERLIAHEARLVVEHIAEPFLAEITARTPPATPWPPFTAPRATTDPAPSEVASGSGSTKARWTAAWPPRRDLLVAATVLLLLTLLVGSWWRAQERERELEQTLTIASRDLGIVMMEMGQFDAARRILVRALSAMPNDSVSQGYLACVLWRQQRVDEARRWAERAGRGPWERCWSSPPVTGGPPTGGTRAPYPSSIP